MDIHLQIRRQLSITTRRGIWMLTFKVVDAFNELVWNIDLSSLPSNVWIPLTSTLKLTLRGRLRLFLKSLKTIFMT